MGVAAAAADPRLAVPQVGDPLAESSQMGALISEEQRERVLALVRGAVADGATVLSGSADKLVVEGLEGGESCEARGECV